MNIKAKFIILFVFISHLGFSQFLHQKGKFIVDGNENEFIIRSMGLGGWMLQEGYMLGTGGFAGTQHEIRALLEASIGEEKTDEFYDAWLANHCTKTDIDSLASWGFNAVRPALHYNLFTLPIEEEPVAGQDTWLETGFKMVDDLLEWCKEHEMYVILDLHAAPGGQGKNADISDYDESKPSLWESEENQRKTVALWKKLAERYANEKYIGGFDLINETNWNFNGTHNNGCDSSNEKLRELMIRITNSIREVDQNHIIFIEGNCWANNMNGMFPPWDENMAYSFHKYWNDTQSNTIVDFLNWRDEYNVPMWMGESGENSNQWFYETIQMLEENKIGWSWWPLKKIGSVVGPLTAVKTDDYQQLLDTWKNGESPDPQFCYNTVMEITENLMIANCVYHPDVIDAMFRQQADAAPIPFKEHSIPGIITAVDYDMGRHDIAYHDDDVMNANGNGGAQWNKGWTYRNDGVDIEECEDDSEKSNGYNVAWLNKGEWMLYTVDVKEKGAYTVNFRIAGTSGGGKFHLESSGKNITGVVSAKSTSGNQDWTDVKIEGVILEKGTHQIKFVVDNPGFNLNYFEFNDPKDISSVPTKALNAYGSDNGSEVLLAINKNMNESIAPAISDFRLKVNGFIREVNTISYDEDDKSKLRITPVKNIKSSDEVYLSYIPGELKSEDNLTLESFSNLPVSTNTIIYFTIPGQIEAEDYSYNYGWIREDCSDENGGYDMGYTDDGDYLDYPVSIEENGVYEVEYRLASGNASGGSLQLQLVSANNEISTINTVGVPSTGGWQDWTSIKRELELPKGENKLRVMVNKREFNLNWIKFSLLYSTGISQILTGDAFRIFPNPAKDKLIVSFSKTLKDIHQLNIFNLNGVMVASKMIGNTVQEIVNLDQMKDGMYFLQLSGNTINESKSFAIVN